MWITQGFSQWDRLTWYFGMQKECKYAVDGHRKGMNKYDFCKGVHYNSVSVSQTPVQSWAQIFKNNQDS